MRDFKPLTPAMSNQCAWRLGEIAKAAGSISRTDVGDPIDRGLILRKLLEEGGFVLSIAANSDLTS